MSEFEFPTNIKQIGSIEDGMKIYMEDYAFTYLQLYAESGGFEERLAFLIGRQMVIDGQTVLFISGTVQGMYTIVEKDTTLFTEKSWQYAREQIKKYFRGLEIIGWMQSQPGYGVYLNSNYSSYHKKTFTKPEQVMFVMDPAEKINVFYVWNDERDNLTETKGYFIYYDKNRGMHEYMLDNKLAKVKLKPLKDEVNTNPYSILKEVTLSDTPELKIKRNYSGHSKNIFNEAPTFKLIKEPKSLFKEQSGNKKVVNMLVSLCAVLFFVCFVMGAGLIQNDGRISTMERELTQLNTAYRDLLLQVKESNTTSVFASQGDIIDKDTIALNEGKEHAELISENGNLALNEDDIFASLPTAPPVTTPEPTVEPKPTQENTTTENPSSNNEANSNETSKREIPDTYKVQQGDSLLSISQKFYGNRTMVKRIMEFNNMDDPDKIYFGKVLKLPKE